MKRALYLLASLTMVSAAAFAQTKKSFTLEDLLPGGKNFYNLLPQNNHGLTLWSLLGDTYRYTSASRTRCCRRTYARQWQSSAGDRDMESGFYAI